MADIGIWEHLSFLGALLLIEAAVLVYHFYIRGDGDRDGN